MFKNKEYIIWGTGRIAQKFYQKYVEVEKKIPPPKYWCDSDISKQGLTLKGIEIVSPNEIYRLDNHYYINGKRMNIIIGTSSINLIEIVNSLIRNNVKSKVYGAVQLDAQCFFRKNVDELNDVMEMFADNKSIIQYENIVRNLQNGVYVDFSNGEINQYFDNDVIDKIMEGEVIVDAGACKGEEIDKALKLYPGIKIYAFEPDTTNYRFLKDKYRNYKNVFLYQNPLWNEHIFLNFSSNNLTSASRLNDINEGESGEAIECETIDRIFQNIHISFIKMDIEGAEYNALIGARNIIKRDKPNLAICIYHNVEDYIRIPLLIKDFYSDYKLYFRHHSIINDESVLYAIAK